MRISIEETILRKYPNMEIGYLTALVEVRKTDLFVEDLKQNLVEGLKKFGINATNYMAHPNLSVWRKIYKDDFQVREKSYRSSVEALLRRVVTGKELWNICNIVDLYNCCSILSLLPMGGYDLSKIRGDIQIRYALDGELFHGIGEKEKIEAKNNHVVYADDGKLICWLWNHKDAAASSIDQNTKQVIFFIDSADAIGSNAMQEALVQLSTNLEKIGGRPIHQGFLNSSSPHATLQGF